MHKNKSTLEANCIKDTLVFGEPGGIRTHDLLIRSVLVLGTLYINIYECLFYKALSFCGLVRQDTMFK